MFSWATQQIEKLSEKVAPPPTDAIGKYVYCMQRNDEEGAMACLAEIPDPTNTVVQPAKGATALHVACQAGSARMIRYLLLQPGASLVVLDHVGNSPLHYACMCNDKQQAVPVVKMLVTEFNASVVAKNGQGKTPYDVATINGVRQYLLPLQLQQETQHALDNGGVGLPPGIDLGGLRVSGGGVPPPPRSAPPTAPYQQTVHQQHTPSPRAYQPQPPHNAVLSTPSPTSAPGVNANQPISPPQASPPGTTKPPKAPTSGNNREYARTGSSSACVYTGGKFKPDGFHSSSSDRNLQQVYGNVEVQRQVAPPPTSGNSAPSSLGQSGINPMAMRSRGRYPVYDAHSGRTTPSSLGAATPPHSSGSVGGSYHGGAAAAVQVPTPPHSGNVFNPAAAATPQQYAAPDAPYSAPVSHFAQQQHPQQQYPTNGGSDLTSPHSDGGAYGFTGTAATPGATDTSGLPAGWTQAVDPASGRTYFVNAAQNVTTWERPTPPMPSASPMEKRSSSIASAQELFAGPSPEKQEGTEEPKEETEKPDAPEPQSSGLPDGWTEVMDPSTGRPYFHNSVDNVTTWERPTLAAATPDAPEPEIAEAPKSAQDVFAGPSPDKQESKDDVQDQAKNSAALSQEEESKKEGDEEPEPTKEEPTAEGSAEKVPEPNTENEAEVIPEEQPLGAHEQVEDTDEQPQKDSPSSNVSGGLPEGWTEVMDPNTGRPYFYNAKDNVTTWERPTAPVVAAATTAEPTTEPEKSDSNAPESAPEPAQREESKEAAEPKTTETATDSSAKVEETEPEVKAADHEGVNGHGKEAQATPNGLPEGWTEAMDPATGRPYYHNAAENITTWERPSAPLSLGADASSGNDSAASPPALPEGWIEAVDPTSGRTYYCNTAQNITTWERPAAAASSLSTPSVPAQQAISHVVSASSTASAQDVFAGPSPENNETTQTEQASAALDKPGMPDQRAITDETARSSSSLAAELFAAPNSDPNAGLNATTSALKTASTAEPDLTGAKEESSEEASPFADVTKETPDDADVTEEDMSEVPLDENPAETSETVVSLDPTQQEQPSLSTSGTAEGGSESLFSAIGLPPPPFRSAQ